LPSSRRWRSVASTALLDADSARSLRVAVYTDQAYWREGQVVSTARAFIIFLGELRASVERLVVLGRLDPRPGRSHYRLPASLEFVGLPHYTDASKPLDVARATAGSIRRFWRVLDDVDTVWILGPYPLSIALVALAALRRKRVFLGVRQDMPEYVRRRHPKRRSIQLAASALERAYRLLSRRFPVVVVGPDLARGYRRAGAILEISASLVREQDISRSAAIDRSYGGDLLILSVGRLDPEKNPLLLVDVLAQLRQRTNRWRLVVCGDGPLEGALVERLEATGMDEFTDLKGHVPIDSGLMDLYRGSHFFLHVSWTEGLPQVLLEAFAARLPVVATAVGGVPDAVDGAAVLIPPGDARAAVEALVRLSEEEALRRRLVEAGLERARRHTIESEARRVADFLAAP
jgi:glycosyltransferase involved in cell wall biosynthesis